MPDKENRARKIETVHRGPGKITLRLTVNGEEHEIHVEQRRTLLDVLRKDLGLTGTKKGCDEGTCGACTVLVDGRAIYACMALALDCEGKSVETIENLEKEGRLHAIQRAFIEQDGLQCGFCTPGQIMSAKALLSARANPSPKEIRESLSGNICRCGAYPKILKAVLRAAELLQQGS
jgi:xanthine dehydrogenase YagT iron-sulfur-binding subunit